MFDSGIFTESSADRVHRNYKLRIIVLYICKIAKFTLDSVIGSQQIRHLNIYPLVRLDCYKVNFSGTENADRDFKPLSPEMIPYHIFHDLLNTTPYIRPTNIVADAMV